MINIDNKFDIGQTVYLKTDTDQSQRIISAIKITVGHLIYEVCCGTNSSWHYDFEMSEQVDVLKTI